MKVTIESKCITSTVSVPHDDMGISEMVDLIRQALLGFGFHPTSVSELFAE